MAARLDGCRNKPAPKNDNFNDNARSDGRVVETSIPFRLDALHWSGFHTRVVLALGITWILDGWRSRWRVRCPEH